MVEVHTWKQKLNIKATATRPQKCYTNKNWNVESKGDGVSVRELMSHPSD